MRAGRPAREYVVRTWPRGEVSCGDQAEELRVCNWEQLHQIRGLLAMRAMGLRRRAD